MRIFAASVILFIVARVTMILFPPEVEAASLAQVAWQLLFADEFSGTDDLVGWNVDYGDGNCWIDTGAGILHLESNWGYTYPMVWRNDLYSSINANSLDYAIEVRFRRPYLTGYGSAIGVGTTYFSGARLPAGDPYPSNNYENILTNEQHQPIGQFDGHQRICMYQPGKPIPADYLWHTGRAEFVNGTGYHYFDGSLVQAIACSLRPISTYFGNAYVQGSIGSWSTLDIDYIRIYSRRTASGSSIYLPLILK